MINEFGRTLTGMIQPGLRPLLSPESAKNEFFIVSNLMTLRHSQAKAFGALDHVVLKHKNANIICIPKGNVVYYISVNPSAKSVEDIIRKVKSVV